MKETLPNSKSMKVKRALALYTRSALNSSMQATRFYPSVREAWHWYE